MTRRRTSYVVPSAEGRRALLQGAETDEDVRRMTHRFAEKAREYAKKHGRVAD